MDAMSECGSEGGSSPPASQSDIAGVQVEGEPEQVEGEPEQDESLERHREVVDDVIDDPPRASIAAAAGLWTSSAVKQHAHFPSFVKEMKETTGDAEWVFGAEDEAADIEVWSEWILEQSDEALTLEQLGHSSTFKVRWPNPE